MTLDKSALETGLTVLFTAPPASFSGCADQWAAAVYNYSVSVLPLSTTAALARDTLAAALATAFSTSTDAATTANSMEASFLAYATTLALGMLPAYTGVPPTTTIGFATIFSTTSSTASEAVSAFADKIDPWFKTGSATLVAPPNTVVTWT